MSNTFCSLSMTFATVKGCFCDCRVAISVCKYAICFSSSYNTNHKLMNKMMTTCFIFLKNLLYNVPFIILLALNLKSNLLLKNLEWMYMCQSNINQY